MRQRIVYTAVHPDPGPAAFLRRISPYGYDTFDNLRAHISTAAEARGVRIAKSGRSIPVLERVLPGLCILGDVENRPREPPRTHLMLLGFFAEPMRLTKDLKSGVTRSQNS